jgi:hypothetical protein
MLAVATAGWLALPGWGAVTPESLFDELSKDFGSVPRGPMLTHYFRLSNTTGQPLKVSSVRVSCGCVTATVMQGELRAGESTVVMAQMDSRRFSGPKSVTIYVQFERPFNAEVRLVVSANGRDDVALTPESFVFGVVQRGKDANATVKVSFHGDPQFQVTEASCDSNYVQPAVKEVSRDTAGVTYAVTAQMRPDVPVGKWFTDVWLKTSNAGSPRIRIPLTVEIEPALVATPTNLQWDQPLAVGGNAERKIILKGVKPFRIIDVKGTDGELAVVPQESAAKQIHIVTFMLKPESQGEFHRTLRIVTDLPEDNEIEFQARAKVQPKQ